MSRAERIADAMKHAENIRNIAICAHIDHGKTTFCDGLLAGAGMMSAELAGQSRQLDFRPDEIERGITIDAACTTMLFSHGNVTDAAEKKKELLVNLIDTPGHIDFGGDVTRAMHIVDGCIVLVDAVEGVMPQTETVLRQALRAYVKPILFINKVDRLIKELRLSPEQMQERFSATIASVNKFIEQFAPQQKAVEWQVSVAAGSVLFGSAVHNWALSLAVIRDKSVSLSQIIELYEKGDEEVAKLRRIVPLHECVVAAIHTQLPDPKSAASYRLKYLWHGEMHSPAGRGLLHCDPAAYPVFVVSKIETDANGELATGRIFSGTITQGTSLIVQTPGANQTQPQKVMQIYVRNGSKKEAVESACAGNIVAITGLDVAAGQTLCDGAIIMPFTGMTHIFEPVITKAIEPERAAELPQLETTLRAMQKEDPGLVVDVNKETGEYLISGYGELHLEIIENRIRDVKKLAVRTSAPLIVYREEVSSWAVGEQTSSLDESTVRIKVEPQPAKGDLTSSRNDIVCSFHTNILCCAQKLTPSTIEAFCDIMRRGPLANEPCHNMIVTVETFVGENPGVMYPLFKEALRTAILAASPSLLEPIQEIRVDGPAINVGEMATLVTSRKGDIIDMIQDVEHASVSATIPVASSLGMSGELRGVTSGRGSISIVKQYFARVPEKDQAKIVRMLRDRKGLF